MVPTQLTFIKDIDFKKFNYTIKCRIIRTWNQYNFDKPNEIYSAEMVLLDEQSTKIQATCEVKCFPKFKRIIVEGTDLYVTNPMLVENKNTYKFGQNPNKLLFTYDTDVSQCLDFTPSICGFSFADYALIQSNTLQANLAYACTNCNCATKMAYVVADQNDGSEQSEYHPVYNCKTSKCNDLVITVTPRFKIPLRVADYSYTVSLTLFDSYAHKLLGKTAHTLHNKYTQLGDANVLPQEFNTFIDKKWAFKIEVSDYNLTKGGQLYSIKKLTTDETIISELEKRKNAQMNLQSDSLNANSSDFGSQETKTHKDSISCTGENSTPSTTTKTTIQVVSPADKINLYSIPTNSKLKRSLEDVFDVEDYTISSSTKQPKLSTAVPKQKALLIPKLEK